MQHYRNVARAILKESLSSSIVLRTSRHFYNVNLHVTKVTWMLILYHNVNFQVACYVIACK